MFDSKELKRNLILMSLALTLAACGGGSSGGGDTNPDPDPDPDPDPVAATCETPATTTHDAFLEFGDNVEIALATDGCTVEVTTNGLPDHQSFYWDPAHALYEAPTATQEANRTPTVMNDSFANDVSFSVSVDPELATSTTGTTLGAVGVAVSGGFLYNQNEAGNEPINTGTTAGLDNSFAHIGPTVYHYHFEPKAYISDDNEDLIGVIADGFFIYGRKCWGLGGETPDAADLDSSGGHVLETQYSGGEDEYHYHIIGDDGNIWQGNYMLFPGDYQGTPSNIGA